MTGCQAGQDQPTLLRQSSHTTRNQLPCRYWKFALQWHNTPPSAFNMWDALHTCLHLMVGLYNALGKSTLWRHSTWTIMDLSDMNSFWHGWGLLWCCLYGRFLDGGIGPKDICSQCSYPTTWKPKGQLPIEVLWVSGQYNPESNVQGKITQ